MTRERLAIIGNGMATGRLIDELVRRGGLERYRVSIFGDEPHGCYNRVLLNRVLLGDSIDDITIKTAAWYAGHGIELHSGARVDRVSPAARRLWTEEGRECRFDKVVFATGSTARVPSVEGARLEQGGWKPGVAVYRTLADVMRMRSAATPGRSAVVIGGGLLGLEAAKGLADLGMRVTLVHLFDTLMNRQLDETGGKLLRRSIERLGITVRLSAATEEILGEHAATGVRLRGGEVLPADLVVFASGVQPRIDLAQEAGLPTGRGVLVNDRLATDVPGVFAVGECIEHAGQVYGTMQPVYEQCAVLADLLANPDSTARYRGSKIYTRLKVAGVEVASMGEIDPRDRSDEVLQVVEQCRGVYRKLIVRENRLAGAVLVGDTSTAAALIQRLERGDPLPANRLDLFASADLSPTTADDWLCQCSRVNETQVTKAIKSGCRTLQELAQNTGAGSGCGSCRGKLAALLLQSGSPSQPLEVS